MNQKHVFCSYSNVRTLEQYAIPGPVVPVRITMYCKCVQMVVMQNFRTSPLSTKYCIEMFVWSLTLKVYSECYREVNDIPLQIKGSRIRFLKKTLLVPFEHLIMVCRQILWLVLHIFASIVSSDWTMILWDKAIPVWNVSGINIKTDYEPY